MSWRDERIGQQIEWALADIRLSQGCEVEILVYGGQVLLVAQLGRNSELDTILRALATVPGVRNIDIDVAIIEPIFVSKHDPRNGRSKNRGLGRPDGLNQHGSHYK